MEDIVDFEKVFRLTRRVFVMAAMVTRRSGPFRLNFLRTKGEYFVGGCIWITSCDYQAADREKMGSRDCARDRENSRSAGWLEVAGGLTLKD